MLRLQVENAVAAEVAVDRPSQSMLNFMQKHYNLVDPIWQPNNYAVYPSFFEILG